MEKEAEKRPMLDWRQGDIVLTPFELPIIFSRIKGRLEVQFYPATHGIVVISQTCDIVKCTDNCAYVQIAPLVEVEDDEAIHIIRGKRPRLVIIPGLMEKGLAIDLDACATINKDLIAMEERIVGCPDDESQAAFSRALARHRGRFAFPDDFNKEVAAPIAEWISSKYKKSSPQGDLVKTIEEVRAASDNWENPSFIHFYLLCSDPMPIPLPREWVECIESLTKKISKTEKYPDPELILVNFSDISAEEYRNSIELDWDGISTM